MNTKTPQFKFFFSSFLIAMLIGIFSHGTALAVEILNDSAEDIKEFEITNYEHINLYTEVGEYMDTISDIDGDGFNDILIGGRMSYENDEFNSAQVVSGKDGSIIYYFEYPSMYIQTIFQSYYLPSLLKVKSCGDFNNDGQEDFVVYFPPFPFPRYYRNYPVRNWLQDVFVYSGKDGTQLASFPGSRVDRYAESVDNAGDVDGDGYDDLIIGAPNGGDVVRGGYVEIYSGNTHERLLRIDGERSRGQFGIQVLGVGDIDDDGKDEFAVLSQDTTDLFFTVYSLGADANASNEIQLTERYIGYGSPDFVDKARLMSLGVDADKDGLNDIALGTSKYLAPNAKGKLQIYSVRDGRPIKSITGNNDPSIDHEYGLLTSPIKDYNGDGFSDFLIYTNATINAPKYIQIFSGKDLSILDTIQYVSILRQVLDLGDVNNDGRSEIALIEVKTDEIYSAHFLTKQRTRVSSHTVSAHQGGTITFDHDYGPTMAGQLLINAGSATGKGPFNFMGSSIPLTVDSYFSQTVTKPNYMTHLDDDGRGQTTLVLPPKVNIIGSTGDEDVEPGSVPTGPVYKGLEGTTLFHAPIVFDSFTATGVDVRKEPIQIEIEQ